MYELSTYFTLFVKILNQHQLSSLCPQQLGLQFVIVDGNDHLLVITFHDVAIVEDPFASAFGFIILEFAFEIGSIGIGPSACHESVFTPFSNIFHSSGIEDISSLTVFFTIQPLARVDILIWVDEHALTLFSALLPLAIILTFINVDQSSDAMFEVILKLACIDIAVGVGILAFSTSKLTKERDTPLT